MKRGLLLACLLASVAPLHAQSATPARLTVEPMLVPSGPADVADACDRGLTRAFALRAAVENDPVPPTLDTFRQFDDLSMMLAATDNDADLGASTSPDEAIRTPGPRCKWPTACRCR